MSQVLSYTFTGDLVHESEEGRQQARIAGEWAAPDRLHQTVEGEDGHVSELVAVGRRVFTRDSDHRGGAWEEQAQRHTPPPGNAAFAIDLEDLQMLQDGTIDDVPVFSIHGVKRATTPGGMTTAYSLFISKAEYRLICMVADLTISPPVDPSDEPKDGQEEQVTQRAIYYFRDYDRPITIEPPILP